MTSDNKILDTGLFGHFMRTARINAGYEKAEDFAKAVSEKTGYPVSKQTIYSVESGKQEPKLSLYLAMMRVLFPDASPNIDKVVLDSLPARWRLPLSVEEEISATSDSEESTETMTQTYGAVYAGLSDSVADMQKKLSFKITESMQPSIRLMSDSIQASMHRLAGNMLATNVSIGSSGLTEALGAASLTSSHMVFQNGSNQSLDNIVQDAPRPLSRFSADDADEDACQEANECQETDD